MNRKKIAKLRRELESLRAGKYNLRPTDLVRFARKVGRDPDTSRGKEPTYVSVLPGTRPLSIPAHPKINPYTAESILDHLEADLDRWEDLAEAAEAEEKNKNENSKGLPSATIRKGGDSGRTK